MSLDKTFTVESPYLKLTKSQSDLWLVLKNIYQDQVSNGLIQKDEPITPKNEYLAKVCKCSQRTIGLALVGLKQHGFIRTEHVPNFRGEERKIYLTNEN